MVCTTPAAYIHVVTRTLFNDACVWHSINSFDTRFKPEKNRQEVRIVWHTFGLYAHPFGWRETPFAIYHSFTKSRATCHLPFLYKVACNLTCYKICFTEMWTVLLNDTERAMTRYAWHFVVSRNSTASTCLHMWSCPVFSRSGINHSSNVATNCHRPLQRRPTHSLLID